MEAAWTSKTPAIPNKRRTKVVFTAIFNLSQRPQALRTTLRSTPNSSKVRLFKGL